MRWIRESGNLERISGANDKTFVEQVIDEQNVTQTKDSGVSGVFNFSNRIVYLHHTDRLGNKEHENAS